MGKKSKSTVLQVKKSFQTNKVQKNNFKNKKTKNTNLQTKNKKTKETAQVDIDFDKLEKAYDEFEDEDFEDGCLDEEEEGELDLADELYGDEEEISEDEEGFDEELDEENEEEEEEKEEERESSGKVKKQKTKREKNLLKWEKELLSNGTAISAFKSIQSALSSAVENIDGGESKENKSTSCNVREPEVFNNIIRICLTRVPPALHRLFELKTLSDRPARNRKWLKLSNSLKKYLKSLIFLVRFISDPTLIEKILRKGILPMLPFFHEFSTLSWQLTKQIATFWCTSKEEIRVLSVVTLFRLITAFKGDQREKVLKLLYVSYVKNCKFTSPSTWPMIDFMRMSLAELYNMDQALAYRHGFIYIRQLASHLRNAMLIQKKERLQLVYNWQFVHCLHFWSELLCKAHPSPVLNPLTYPLVQICHGTLNLMKSPSHYPFTFHIVNILSEISEKTGIFIPVLPYLMEVISSKSLITKPKKSSMRPFQWLCIIKVSKSQLLESAFCDGLVEQFFNSSLNYLNSQCHTIGFPELVFPLVLQLKSFLKKCKVVVHSKKVKQLLDKINENSQFISERRKDVTFKLTDTEAINNWEIEVSQVPPPLRSFCKQWNEMTYKIRKNEQKFSEENKDEFSISALRKRQRYDGDDLEDGDILRPLLKKKKNSADESREKGNTRKEDKKLGTIKKDSEESKFDNIDKDTYNFNNNDKSNKNLDVINPKITYFDSDGEFEGEKDIVREMKL